MTFKTAIAEARHRHNFPALCRVVFKPGDLVVRDDGQVGVFKKRSRKHAGHCYVTFDTTKPAYLTAYVKIRKLEQP